MAAVKQLGSILKTNVRACKALGHAYVSQLGRIYLDMLNVYKIMSENITQAIALNGLAINNQPLIKAMHVVKKETLTLISEWVSKSNDSQMVMENFIPPLLETVLFDYQVGLRGPLFTLKWYKNVFFPYSARKYRTLGNRWCSARWHRLSTNCRRSSRRKCRKSSTPCSTVRSTWSTRTLRTTRSIGQTSTNCYKRSTRTASRRSWASRRISSSWCLIQSCGHSSTRCETLPTPDWTFWCR